MNERDEALDWFCKCGKPILDNQILCSVCAQKQINSLEKALDQACELVYDYVGTCPEDQFSAIVAIDCYYKCDTKGYTPTDCWKRYFIEKAKSK